MEKTIKKQSIENKRNSNTSGSLMDGTGREAAVMEVCYKRSSELKPI
ncbi:unnamed protein product [Arabidopsis lyrata]|nr:unnamed protein product [Arabidopsis lyrata]